MSTPPTNIDQPDAPRATHDQVLVIGASRGRGLAITGEYLRRGARVTATIRTNADDALIQLAESSGGKLEVEHVDTTDVEQVYALTERVGRTEEVDITANDSPITEERGEDHPQTTRRIDLGGGRALQFRVSGPQGALPVVFHHGTPGTLPSRALQRAVHARGLRLLTIARPGYAGSTRAAGRAVVDVVADTAAVLDALGADRCLVLGWSGGGPHALACAARLPGALRALVVAGLAPPRGEGLDFFAGMGGDDAQEWSAAFAGEERLRAHVEAVAPADIAAPSNDADDPSNELAEDLAAANRDALRWGVDGWVDDELAFTAPWGFDLAEVTLPVSLWHGSEDVNVPAAHGRWVANHLPGSTWHLAHGEDHLSIMLRPLDRMLDHLTTAA